MGSCRQPIIIITLQTYHFFERDSTIIHSLTVRTIILNPLIVIDVIFKKIILAEKIVIDKIKQRIQIIIDIIQNSFDIIFSLIGFISFSLF